MTPRLIGTLLCVLAFPASALSGQADTTRRAKDSTARAAQPLAPVVVSASREPMRQTRLGVSASVLTARDLQTEPAFTATDAAGRMPGVYMDANAGPVGPTNIRLRGSDDAFTKVLMDGIEVNVSGGPFRFQGMTIGNVDRVELVRGPQSALHGSSAMAGVIQYFTAAGQPGKPKWTVEGQGGSAAERGAHGGVRAAVSGGDNVFRYSAGAGGGYEQGIYAVTHRLRSREASTRLDFDPAGPVSLTGTLRYQQMSSHLPVRNPGTTRVPLDPNQRDENELFATGLTATITPSAVWTHQVRLGVFHDVFSYTDQRDVVPPHDTIPYFNGDAYSSTNLTRSTLSYGATRRFDATNGRAAALTFGGTFEREATGDTVGGDFGNAFTPQRRNHSSLFSEITANVTSAVSVLGGASLDWYEGLGWAIVPRANMRAEIVPDRFALRAAAGRGFKAPNISQQFTSNAFIVPNPDLKPETSWSGEVGADFTLTNGATFSATYFQQRFYDLIRVVAAPAPETRAISKNLGRTDANGVELIGTWTSTGGVTASGNFSWVHTSIVDNAGQGPNQFPVDSALPSRPFYTGGASVAVPFGRLRAIAHATVVGKNIVLTEIFNGRRRTLDPYQVLGLTVNYEVRRELMLYVRGDNLLNAFYPAGFDRRGIPRALTMGLRMTN